MPGRTPSALDSASLAAIYASALAENAWQDAVEFIVDRLGAVAVILSLRVASEGIPTVGVQAFRGQGRAVWQGYWRDYADAGTFDYSQVEPGQIHALSDHAQDQEAMRRVSRELLAPHGVGETYCLPLGSRDQPHAYLIWMNRLGENLTSDQRAWCGAAFPHLNRAMAGYQRLRQAELAARLGGDALGHLAIGVAAVDREDRILFANEQAQRTIARSPDLGAHNGRLVSARPQLAALLSQARQRTLATRIRGEFDQIIGVLMAPVAGRDEMGPGSWPERAIYFHDSSASARIPEQIVAELFDLPRNEARLACLLAAGLTLRESSAELGVTENTARTYSKLLFSRLGISRQVDLVRIVLRSVAMLGAEDAQPTPYHLGSA